RRPGRPLVALTSTRPEGSHHGPQATNPPQCDHYDRRRRGRLHRRHPRRDRHHPPRLPPARDRPTDHRRHRTMDPRQAPHPHRPRRPHYPLTRPYITTAAAVTGRVTETGVFRGRARGPAVWVRSGLCWPFTTCP